MILNRDTNLYDLCARGILVDSARQTPIGSVDNLIGMARSRGKRKSVAMLRTMAYRAGAELFPDNHVREQL